MSKPTVLVTVCDGTADYVTFGDVNVVLVDYGRLEATTTFPDELDTVLSEVASLPDEIRSKRAVHKIVQGLRTKARQRLLQGPVHDDDVPEGDAR